MKKNISILLGLLIVSMVVMSCDPTALFDDVTNQKPIPDAGGDQVVILGAVVQLNGSGSYDPEASPLNYEWTLTSSPALSVLTSIDLNNPTVFFSSFTPDVEGFYTVRLTVSDGFDEVADDIIIQVQPAPASNDLPTVDFDLSGTDVSGTTNVSMDFAVTAADSDGSIASYSWDFGDGSSAETGAGPKVHTYTVAGTYTVEVTVVDNDGGQAVDSLDVTVNDPAVDPAPKAAFSASAKEVDLNGGASVSVTFTDYTSSKVDENDAADIASYLWTYGDGGTSGTQGSTSHNYTKVGVYTVTLTVTDDAGQSSTDSLGIKVIDTNPPVVPTIVEITPNRDVSLSEYGDVVNDKYVFTGFYKKNRYGGLFDFDFKEAFEKGWVIHNAVLYLDYFGSEGSIDRLDVQMRFIQTDFRWTEIEPGKYEELLSVSDAYGGVIVLSKLTTYKVDVTEIVAKWMDNKESAGLFLEPLRQDPEEALAQFTSRESGSPGIRLEIEYTLP